MTHMAKMHALGRHVVIATIAHESNDAGPIATARPTLAFPFRSKTPQRSFVFTWMTLELGLVPLPLYARNR